MIASAIEKALAWLLSAQEKDGGWHSETYGALRGGAAVTSLVLYAACHLSEEQRSPHAAAWKKGYEFLRPGLKKQGKIVLIIFKR